MWWLNVIGKVIRSRQPVNPVKSDIGNLALGGSFSSCRKAMINYFVKVKKGDSEVKVHIKAIHQRSDCVT